MKRIGLVMALLLIAVPSLAQKIYIDYDRDADLGSYKTWAWAKTSETSLSSSNSLAHSRIKNAIEHQMSLGGMAEVESNPDVYLTYHTSTKDELQVNTNNSGVGYGGGWHRSPYWGSGWGGGMSTTTVSTYEKGTLVIDLYDAKTKQMVWRGSATATVPSKPEKAAKQIDKAVAKMSKKWKKMYDGQ